jgi:hypothetical protein
VGQLTGPEVWLFIVGRVLVAFGLGLIAATYMPALVAMAWPAVIVGAVALLIAAKGLGRRGSASPPEA